MQPRALYPLRRVYTVSIDEAPASKVLAAFAEQTGVHLVPADAPQMTGPPIVASLHLKDVDLETALDRLGRALASRIEPEGMPDKQVFRVWPDGYGLRNFVDQTPKEQGAKVVQVIRTATLPSQSTEIAGSVRVVIRVWPGKQSAECRSQLEGVEATDEHGRLFGLLQSGAGSVSYVNESAQPTELSVALLQPSAASRSIESFKATAVFSRMKTIKRFTAEHFAEKAVTCDIDGHSLEIGPARIDKEFITVPLRTDDVALGSTSAFQGILPILARRMSLSNGITATSRPPMIRPDPTKTLGRLDCTFFIPRVRNAATQPVDLDKLNLTWELPGESEFLRFPVSAAKLPLP